jgi:hypothetical protein
MKCHDCLLDVGVARRQACLVLFFGRAGIPATRGGALVVDAAADTTARAKLGQAGNLTCRRDTNGGHVGNVGTNLSAAAGHKAFWRRWRWNIIATAHGEAVEWVDVARETRWTGRSAAATKGSREWFTNRTRGSGQRLDRTPLGRNALFRIAWTARTGNDGTFGTSAAGTDRRPTQGNGLVARGGTTELDFG